MLYKLLKFIDNHYALVLGFVGTLGIALEWWNDSVLLGFLFTLSWLNKSDMRKVTEKLNGRIDDLVQERYDLYMKLHQLKMEIKYLNNSRPVN